jgi:hypothetical protein
LGNLPPTLSLDPGEPVNLEGGLPAGGVDDSQVVDKSGPVEVTVTDDSGEVVGELPIKKPSLGRSSRVGVPRTVGLQRHIKRESMQQTETTPPAESIVATVRRSLEGGKPVGVTLSDGPTRE